MFTLNHVRIAAVLSLGFAAMTGCQPETDSDQQAVDQTAVDSWLQQNDILVTALDKDDAGAYNFSLELGEGRVVVNIAAEDGTPLAAPLTFHPARMEAFLGRNLDLKPGEIDRSEAGHWITSKEAPALCAKRKVASSGFVTLADGSEHRVGVGISWATQETSYIDITTGGCPNPAGGKGKAACDAHPKCAIDWKLLELHGDCWYSDLIPFVNTCYCEVLFPVTTTDSL